MPVTELKEEGWSYKVYLPSSSGLDIEVLVKLDWPGDAYWTGGRGEPWSLEVVKEPTFEIVSSVLCDGEDTPTNLSQKAVPLALEQASEAYWETYND